MSVRAFHWLPGVGNFGRLHGFRNPRIWQILSLGSFFLLGVLFRDFSLHWAQVILTFASALATQFFFLRLKKLRNVGFLSPMITSLSLVLLLRSDSLWVHPLIASVAIASKFLVRFHGRHIFNPANFGIVLALLLLPGAWVSPGQWGSDLIWGAWIIGLGVTVISRAHRMDLTWSFLLFYTFALVLRVLWLNEEWKIFFHQLKDGSLLVFAFFMVSDPMTSPNHRFGRLAHTAWVVLLAFTLRFWFFNPRGIFWALFLASPAILVWDRLWKAPSYRWNFPKNKFGSVDKP